MNILILIIYSESDLYKKMFEIQQNYYKKSCDHIKKNLKYNIDFYFIQFRQQVNPVEIDNNFIWVKGDENRMKITEKTLSSLKYIYKDLNLSYDFIIRTNISTIINFTELYIFLNSLPKNNIYCTGNILNLQWLDPPSGIKDKSLFGTIYAAGTSIIFSSDVVSYMIENTDKFRYDIVDDVSFGLFIYKYLPDAFHNLDKFIASFLVVNKNFNIKCTTNHVFIRNKIKIQDNMRGQDVLNIKKICEHLLKINYQIL